MKSIDPVDRALDLLRDDCEERVPSLELEAALRGLHSERDSWRPPVRLWVAAAAVFVLAGGVFAASGGIDWLRRWWFSIEVEGQVEFGTVDGGGERQFHFATEDGGTATVRVQRELVDGGDATRIAVDRDGPLGIEREQFEDRSGPAVTPRELFSLQEVEGRTPIYSGRQSDGIRIDLYLLPGGWNSSRIVVHRHGDGDEPVELISRVPFDLLRDGVRGEVTEREDGGLRLSFTDGGGAQFDLMWGGHLEVEPRVLEVQTPDGKVRVRVESERPDR